MEMKEIYKLFFLLFLFSLTGCYEPTEGCLDADATNFDVSADRSCESCCTYPDLKFKVVHKIIPVNQPDTVLSFSYGVAQRVFPDTNHFFKIEKISFLVSNIHLVAANGEETGVKGKLILKTPVQDTEVENNFAKVNAGSSSDLIIGKLQHAGTFTKVKFLFGITDEVNAADPASMPENHPLSIIADSTNWAPGDGYISNSIDFKRDTAAATPVTEIDLFQAHEILLSLPEEKTFSKGHDLKVTLSINYGKWFDGIDFDNDSDETIYHKINENIPLSFLSVTVE